MPFTLTHTAAVLPFTRIAPQLPFSALAIGSMLPDAPIFLTLGFGYSFLHSLSGLLLASVPLGLIAYFVFHRFIKEALISLAPQFISCRLNHYRNRSVPDSLIPVSIALFLGASTHIVWDLFTHAGRIGVTWIPALQAHYALGEHTVAGHQIAQHGSSLVFLPVLLAIALLKLRRLPRKPIEEPLPELRRLTQTAVISAPILSSMSIWSLRTSEFMSFLFETTVASGMLVILAVVGYAICLSLQRVSGIQDERAN